VPLWQSLDADADADGGIVCSEPQTEEHFSGLRKERYLSICTSEKARRKKIFLKHI